MQGTHESVQNGQTIENRFTGSHTHGIGQIGRKSRGRGDVSATAGRAVSAQGHVRCLRMPLQ